MSGQSTPDGGIWRPALSKPLPQCGHVRNSTLPFAEGAFSRISSKCRRQVLPAQFCELLCQSHCHGAHVRPCTLRSLTVALSRTLSKYRRQRINICGRSALSKSSRPASHVRLCTLLLCGRAFSRSSSKWRRSANKFRAGGLELNVNSFGDGIGAAGRRLSECRAQTCT